jgi:rhomboid family GlyGly-CTERM serine protease
MGLINRENETDKALSGAAWRVPVALLLVAAALMLGGDAAREWLAFERDSIRDGEVWRLVTGHLVHLGWPHFALNAAGLGLVWTLVGGAYKPAGWVLIILTSIAAISFGLWQFNPELQWYVGLSGALHGVLAAGLVMSCRRPRIETTILGLLLLCKLAWEQFSGPLPGSESSSGGPVVVDAHLYGAIAGILAGLLTWLIRVRRSRPL